MEDADAKYLALYEDYRALSADLISAAAGERFWQLKAESLRSALREALDWWDWVHRLDNTSPNKRSMELREQFLGD